MRNGEGRDILQRGNRLRKDTYDEQAKDILRFLRFLLVVVLGCK